MFFLFIAVYVFVKIDNSKLKIQNSKLILPLFTPVFLSFYPFLRHNFLGYFVFL